MDKAKLFKEITDSMADLYARKNHDYGDSFTTTANEFGLVAPAIRLSDKLNRFKALAATSAQVTDEKLEDTLMDMASYAIMTVIWLRENGLSSK